MSGHADHRPVAEDAHEPQCTDFLRLHRCLHEVVRESPSESDLICRLLALAQELTNATCAVWWSMDESGTLRPVDPLKSEELHVSSTDLEGQQALVTQTVSEDRVRVLKFQDGGLTRRAIIAVPAALMGSNRGALVLELAVDGGPLDPFIVILQLVAGYASLWGHGNGSVSLPLPAAADSFLLGLSEKVLACGDIEVSSMVLVNELSPFLRCERVALAVQRGRRNHFSTVAVSGFDRFDRHSDFIVALDAAFTEQTHSGIAVCWPPDDPGEGVKWPAHESLFNAIRCRSVATIPLCLPDGERVGAMCFIWAEDRVDIQRAMVSAKEAAACFAPALWLLGRARQGRPRKLIARLLRSRGLRVPAVRAALALAFSVLLFAPIWDVCIKVPCQLSPVKSRSVCAPFDGILEHSEVRTGDVVSSGDMLAQMDGSEIRMVLAGLTAERFRAAKKASQSAARNMIAAKQMAELEEQKLEQDIRVLEHRLDGLEVRSSISGIVLSGELDRAEGAPLIKGQKLFEIAPLDSMLVELLVPDSEVARVEPGLTVSIRLDSFPGLDLRGTVKKLAPMSEIRDMKNVFVAEVEVPNPEGVLRPGMKGRAVIKTQVAPLIWHILRVPVRFISGKILGY